VKKPEIDNEEFDSDNEYLSGDEDEQEKKREQK
jgi:hypothetical protein